MTSAAPPFLEEFSSVPLSQVERKLGGLMKEAHGPGEAPVIQARMSNLVIFCDRPDRADGVAEQIPRILQVHPARVLLLCVVGSDQPEDITAAIRVWSHPGDGRRICSEQVMLRAREQAVERLPFAVRALSIGDLPTNIWWASLQPPPLAGSLLYDLGEYAQQLIYDSIGWVDPHRAVAATSAWLERFERCPGQARWRVASDLNWRRLKFWRRLLGQMFAPGANPGAAESITEVLVEHGPHAVTQAWELVGWMASRLGWQVEGTRVEPGVEIMWRVRGPAGGIRLRIKRRADGPSEVRRIWIACTLEGKPAALNCVVEDELRLAAIPEGVPEAPRTVSIQNPSLAELIGKQLSDREPDPVFREAMAVAQVFAQSVLDSQEAGRT